VRNSWKIYGAKYSARLSTGNGQKINRKKIGKRRPKDKRPNNQPVSSGAEGADGAEQSSVQISHMSVSIIVESIC